MSETHITIHVIHHFPDTLRIHSGTGPTADLSEIKTKLDTIMADLTELTAQVARNTDAEDSAAVLLQGLKAALDAAGTNPAALKALSDQLSTNADKLAAAVVANTPAAPKP